MGLISVPFKRKTSVDLFLDSEVYGNFISNGKNANSSPFLLLLFHYNYCSWLFKRGLEGGRSGQLLEFQVKWKNVVWLIQDC